VFPDSAHRTLDHGRLAGVDVAQEHLGDCLAEVAAGARRYEIYADVGGLPVDP
jgi:hypothetical protein